MIILKVRISCDHYDRDGECQEEAYGEVEYKTDNHDIPSIQFLHRQDPCARGWHIVFRRPGYGDPKQCLCPKHNPANQKHIAYEAK